MTSATEDVGPVTDNGGGLTIDNAALSVTGGGVESSALRVTLASDSTGLLSVDENGGSLTIDNAALSVTGGGAEASALRVTLANDSTGIVSVEGSKLWKDWTELTWQERCPYVFASKGGDFNYASTCGHDAISPWEFDVNYSEFAGIRRLVGLVFTERGVYRMV